MEGLRAAVTRAAVLRDRLRGRAQDRPDLGYEPRREPPQQRGNGTHHPVSRVRYRGAEDADERVEHRRRARGNDADRWEYDI